MIIKATPAQAGCWIGSEWKEYSASRLFTLAKVQGYEPSIDMQRAFDTITKSMTHPEEYFEESEINWASDHVTASVDFIQEWLNDYVAPEGFTFMWIENEFYLMSDI